MPNNINNVPQIKQNKTNQRKLEEDIKHKKNQKVT